MNKNESDSQNIVEGEIILYLYNFEVNTLFPITRFNVDIAGLCRI